MQAEAGTRPEAPAWPLQPRTTRGQDQPLKPSFMMLLGLQCASERSPR